MFLAMNHFVVNADRAADFERAWSERETYLDGTDGYVSFHLLKGRPDADGREIYASHTVWRDEDAFRAWVASDAFRKAHAQGKLTGILTGPPNLMTWTSVLEK
jgi:heme-degrading monooxygenase HmoA